MTANTWWYVGACRDDKRLVEAVEFRTRDAGASAQESIRVPRVVMVPAPAGHGLSLQAPAVSSRLQ